MSTTNQTFPTEFFMHAIQCSLPAGKKGVDQLKEITVLQLEHLKKVAEGEAKLCNDILKILKRKPA